MRLTTKSEYGLLAMIDLAVAEEGTLVSARDMAQRRHIPAKFLEQILSALRQSGLVVSVRGAYGGFQLGRDANSISVLDIVEAVDGPLEVSVCESTSHEAGKCDKHAECAAASVWIRATKVLRDEFSRTTIGSLATLQKQMDAQG